MLLQEYCVMCDKGKGTNDLSSQSSPSRPNFDSNKLFRPGSSGEAEQEYLSQQRTHPSQLLAHYSNCNCSEVAGDHSHCVCPVGIALIHHNCVNGKRSGGRLKPTICGKKTIESIQFYGGGIFAASD